jgi:hypothetical protein
MKKLLLASVFVLAAAPVFAQSVTVAGVNAGQNTDSLAIVSGNHGSAIGGTVAGNYASVSSTAGTSRGGSGATVTEGQVGGTLSGGATSGHGVLVTGGSQGSTVTGFALSSSSQPKHY